MSRVKRALLALFGLRVFHRRTIRMPLYAFQTELTRGRVLRDVPFLRRNRG